MVEEYLREAYKPLIRYMKQEFAAGKEIALWGAGNKGKKFLEIADGKNRIIKFVFDKDENKWGKYLPTGHKIVDYRKHKVDIVVVSGSNIILETRYRLSKLPYPVQIINLDDVAIGHIKPTKHQVPVKTVINRNNKIAALVILFHPDVTVVENIRSYFEQVDYLFLYDNSPCNNIELFSDFLKRGKCKYIYADGNNDGLGKPINVVSKLALGMGVDWLLTFDQDSKVDNGMIDSMRGYINSSIFDESIGILAPMVISPNDVVNGLEYASEEAVVMYVRNVIQSGALINLCIFKNVGEYYERLFIDYVDFEYCLRLRSKGYRIAKISTAKLIHQVDNGYRLYEINGKKVFLGKYSPKRYYYQYRNILYCKEKYKIFDPIFARMCENNLIDLEYLAQIDDNIEQNLEAISKAKVDYLLLQKDIV